MLELLTITLDGSTVQISMLTATLSLALAGLIGVVVGMVLTK